MLSRFSPSMARYRGAAFPKTRHGRDVLGVRAVTTYRSS